MRNLLLTVLLLSQISLAQPAWEKKPYQKWSGKEVNQVLTDSPWAKKIGIGTANLAIAGSSPRRGSALTSDEAAYEATPRVEYQVQLRSALPIRQAVARKLQLDNKYDDLPAEKRAQIDAKINEYVNQTVDSVIVQVAYSSNVPSYLSDVRRYWMAQTAEVLKSSMFLNAGGKKYALTSFVTGEGVFQATFERNKDVSAASNLSFEFQSPNFSTIAEQRVLVQFKPKEMTFQGAVVF